MSRLAVVLDPNWRDRANCQGTSTDEFYPEKGHISGLALRICAGCPVKTECLEEGIENDEQGIWGGKTEPELRKLRKARRRTLNGAAA